MVRFGSFFSVNYHYFLRGLRVSVVKRPFFSGSKIKHSHIHLVLKPLAFARGFFDAEAVESWRNVLKTASCQKDQLTISFISSKMATIVAERAQLS